MFKKQSTGKILVKHTIYVRFNVVNYFPYVVWFATYVTAVTIRVEY